MHITQGYVRISLMLQYLAIETDINTSMTPILNTITLGQPVGYIF